MTEKNFIDKDIRDLTFWETLLGMPNRFITLIWKMVSVKGAVLGLTVFLVSKNAFQTWIQACTYGFAVFLVLGFREAETWLPVIKAVRGDK